MRLVSIYQCEPELTLAKPIYDKNNRVLLNTGYKITANILKRLDELGIHHIYVESEVTEDVEVHDNVPTQLRFEASRSLAKTFKVLTEDNA